MARYQRPNIPYIPPETLPNNNRYELDANTQQSPTADELDGDCNYSIWALNDLYEIVLGIAAGIIPGANDPSNAVKFPVTDGNGNITWTKVTNTYYADNSISSSKYQAGSIQNPALGESCVQRHNIYPQSINDDLVEENSLKFNVIKQENNGAFQNYFNAQNDGTLQFSKLNVPNNSLSGLLLTDNSTPGGKLQDGTVTRDKLTPAAQIPIGATMGYSGPGTVPPAGWLFENGQAVSRTTYAAYFALVGTTYGAGDGTTTFNLRDKRGRASVGLDMSAAGTNAATNSRVTAATASALTVGGNGGLEQITLDVTQIPPHTHSLITGVSPQSNSNNSGPVNIYNNGGQTGSTGGGLPHNNMSPFIFEQSIVYVGV